MSLYKVDFVGDENKYNSIIQINSKCGICDRREEYGYKGLCANNCQFNVREALKIIIQRQNKNMKKIIIENIFELELDHKNNDVIYCEVS